MQLLPPVPIMMIINRLTNCCLRRFLNFRLAHALSYERGALLKINELHSMHGIQGS